MKQSSIFLSTYTADVSGVCSALYELGGMVIMHDASGCNSTYNTHDEPRWYQMDSMIYISALTELDAMLGNDEKLISDICKAAYELNPRFIALCGTPIPMIMGTDYTGIARVIEKRTNIPTFGFNTNGMHSYLSGIDMALSAFAKRFCKKITPKADTELSLKQNTEIHQKPDTGICLKPDTEIHRKPDTENLVKPSVNLLGVTPLDFSITGNVEAMKLIFEENGYRINSCFAMGCKMEELRSAGNAEVNFIVSSSGISTAKYFEEEFGIPYVIGIPMGSCFTKELFSSIDYAVKKKENQFPAKDQWNNKVNPGLNTPFLHSTITPVIIIGEPVFAVSLRYTLYHEFGYQDVTVISPLETDPVFLTDKDFYMPYENDIKEKLKDTKIVIADPLFRRIIAKDSNTLFLDFPHEAYSGRIYRDEIPVIIGNKLNQWLQEKLN